MEQPKKRLSLFTEPSLQNKKKMYEQIAWDTRVAPLGSFQQQPMQG